VRAPARGAVLPVADSILAEPAGHPPEPRTLPVLAKRAFPPSMADMFPLGASRLNPLHLRVRGHGLVAFNSAYS